MPPVKAVLFQERPVTPALVTSALPVAAVTKLTNSTSVEMSCLSADWSEKTLASLVC
jgi:hypothetical protein